MWAEVSWAIGVLGREKVLGGSWACKGRRGSRAGKVWIGVDFHHTRACCSGIITKLLLFINFHILLYVRT